MKKTRWTAPLTAIAIPMMMMFLATVPISAEGITLQEALRQVRSDNPTIRSTHEQLRVTEEGVREARSALLPKLAARGEYTVYGKETLVTPMSEPPTPQSDPLSFDDRIYSGALRLDVPILDLSALSLIGAARHEVEYSRSRSAEADQAILAGVADLFVRYLRLEDNRDLLDAHLSVLERRREDLTVLEAAGRVSPAAKAEADAAIASLLSDRIEIEEGRREISWRLGTLLGKSHPVTPNVTGLGRDTSITVDPGNTAGPTLAAARAQQANAETLHEAVQRSFYPQIHGFVAPTARSGSDLDFSTDWSAGLSVTIPLYTGGERTARLAATDAARKSASYSYEAARNEHVAALRIQEERIETLRQRQELIRHAVAGRQVSLDAVARQFEEGRASAGDLLAEESALLELQIQEQALQQDRLSAYIAYHRQLGTLSESTIEALLEERK
jgi:outer membrane protein